VNPIKLLKNMKLKPRNYNHSRIENNRVRNQNLNNLLGEVLRIDIIKKPTNLSLEKKD
jgi:hypothetical protein